VTRSETDATDTRRPGLRGKNLLPYRPAGNPAALFIGLASRTEQVL
jgi:hypothetical protein